MTVYTLNSPKKIKNPDSSWRKTNGLPSGRFENEKLETDEQRSVMEKSNKLHLEASNIRRQQQMKEELNQFRAPQLLLQATPDIQSIIKDYEEIYSKKPNYKKPETKNGITELSFPSHQEAATFFENQAQLKRKFIIVDNKTNKVIAYSNGDGSLYRPDGKKCEMADFSKPSEVDINQFKMPELKPEPELESSHSNQP